MKKYLLLIIISIAVFSSSCTNDKENPVGPAIWIKPDNPDGSVNWDNYYMDRVIFEYTFDSGPEGWQGDYKSGGGLSSLSYDPNGYIKLSVNNLLADPISGFWWVDWFVNSPVMDYTDLVEEGEILVFEFKAYCSNNSYFQPLMLDLQFGLDWAYFITNYPPGTYDVDYSKCYYSHPEEISRAKDKDGNRIWTHIKFAYSGLKRTSWTEYPELTRDIWMKHVAVIYIAPTPETYQVGFNACFWIDDVRVVIYKHKSAYDPTQAP